MRLADYINQDEAKAGAPPTTLGYLLVIASRKEPNAIDHGPG
jgi:hypothetical protein